MSNTVSRILYRYLLIGGVEGLQSHIGWGDELVFLSDAFERLHFSRSTV